MKFNLIIFCIMCFGGINWLCIGIFQFDLIAGIFGSQAHFISRFLYTIIGLCTVYSLIALFINKGNIYIPMDKTAKKINKNVYKASKNEGVIKNEINAEQNSPNKTKRKKLP